MFEKGEPWKIESSILISLFPIKTGREKLTAFCYTFPKTFSQLTISQAWQTPKCAISQVATSQMYIFKVRFGPSEAQQVASLQWRGLGLARTDFGSEIQLAEMHIRKVAARENTFRESD